MRGMQHARYDRVAGHRAKGLWASNAAFLCPLFMVRTLSAAPRRGFDATAPATGTIAGVYS